MRFWFLLQSVSAVHVLHARGTDEPQNGSRLEPIASAIVAAFPGSTAEAVVYPATLDFVPSVGAGVAFARQRLAAAQGDVILIGYSQGAVVTEASLAGTELFGQNLTAIDPKDGKKVAAIIQFGDPTRVLGQGKEESTCNRTAALRRTGQFKIDMDQYKLQNWCATGDGVCCENGQDFTAHVSYFGNATTARVVDFVREALKERNGTASPTSTPPAQYTGSVERVRASWLLLVAMLALLL